MINYIVDKNKILKILSFFFLDINNRYKLLSDVTSVDFLFKVLRFVVVYNLLSINYHLRVLVFIYLKELDKIESVVSLYPCANWYEREVWDLFGIIFLNHGDLRRILTDYGFLGFPLRKDFPLSGFKEIYFDFSVESLLYRKIKLSQAYRIFKLNI
jgi:NADH/F420H2 dehydrogenase subunit C